MGKVNCAVVPCTNRTLHYKCRVIIDCSEVFIERSKRLDQQATTWSDLNF